MQSVDQGHTEIGGRPFMVFQYTGALPSSNSDQVGREDLIQFDIQYVRNKIIVTRIGKRTREDEQYLRRNLHQIMQIELIIT